LRPRDLSPMLRSIVRGGVRIKRVSADRLLWHRHGWTACLRRYPRM